MPEVINMVEAAWQRNRQKGIGSDSKSPCPEGTITQWLKQ